MRIGYLVSVLLVSCSPFPLFAATSEDTAAAFKEVYEEYRSALRQGDRTRAREKAERALELGEDLYCENHPNTARLTFNYASLFRPKYYHGANAEIVLEKARLALRRYETAFAGDADELLQPMILLVQVLGRALRSSAFEDRESHDAAYSEMRALVTRSETTAKQSADPAALPDLYLMLSKIGLDETEEWADRAIDIYKQTFGENHRKTIIAMLNAVPSYNKSKQLAMYNSILTKSEDLSDFDNYLFAIHQGLAVMYLERDAESQATEHLQAAGSYLEKLDRQNTEYQPINKRQPTYPRRALRRGMSGWVIVEFTVTETGTVEDPNVVANCARVQPLAKKGECVNKSSRVFDNAALEAATGFRYIPRFKEGTPIAVKGVQNKISFELIVR